jgi:hypothetical protein
MAVDLYSTSFDLPIGYDGLDSIVIVGADLDCGVSGVRGAKEWPFSTSP